jgi:hypothetical protein
MWIRNIRPRNEREKSSSPDYRAGQLDNNPDHQLRWGIRTFKKNRFSRSLKSKPVSISKREFNTKWEG